jgi:hypothetical protein
MEDSKNNNSNRVCPKKINEVLKTMKFPNTKPLSKSTLDFLQKMREMKKQINKNS